MGFLQRVEELMEFKEGFVDKLNEFFGHYGLWVYDHPRRVIIASLLLSIIPAFGLFPPRARWVDGADNLYSLPVSQARNEGIIHDTMFKDVISRAQFLIVTSNQTDDNLLTWDNLKWAREVDDLVRGNRVDASNNRLIAVPATEQFYPEWFSDPNNPREPDKQYLTYDDICAPDPVTKCKIQSVFEMGVDETRLMLPEGAPPEIWVFDGLVFNTARKGYRPEFIFGDPTIVNCTRDVPTNLVSQIFTPDRLRVSKSKGTGFSEVDIQCVVSAKALNFVYELWDKKEFLDREMLWEKTFYDVMSDNKHYGPLICGAMAYRSRDDELSKSTAESEDVIYVVYTFILLIGYCTLMNFSLNQYRNKTISSLVGSLSCILGLYAGLGVCGLLGVAFQPTCLVTPFLVMGVGADDIFVLLSSYALAYGEDSPRQRCAVTLRGCGVAVVMTTVTNVIAFAIGIQSPYLSIKNFCLNTLAGLFFSLVYEMTLFYAVICLEARKEDQNKACVFRLDMTTPEADRAKFDIRTTVSTYQLVSVLTARQIASIPLFNPVSAPEYPTEWHWWRRWWAKFVNAGRLAHVPDPALLQACTPDTVSTVESSPQKSEAESESESESEHEMDRSKSAFMMTLEEALKLLPKKIPVNRFALHDKLRHPAYQQEPNDTIGKTWREVFVKYYCKWLLHPVTKAVVLIVFTANLGVALYGCTRLVQGLEMKDLSPDEAYLKTYDTLQGGYMNATDMPVEVFYADSVKWHEPRAMHTLKLFEEKIAARRENDYMSDSLTRIYNDPIYKVGMQSGNETVFLATLKRALSDPNSAYKQFELDYIWRGDELVTWRSQLLPTGTKSSKERANWMLRFRDDAEWLADLPNDEETVPMGVMMYNYLMVFNESDIAITASVISALSTAGMALLVIALMLIPDLSSGGLVILLMILIDLTVIGYMAFWQVNLNMISMIILVISIGFAVDYSAHICYAFVNGVGPTRDIRVVESIVLVGTPLFHGAMSNFLGIMLLGFSTSYILRVFFKMMTLVVLLGISHGMILLPVILSLVGKMSCSVPILDEEKAALVRHLTSRKLGFEGNDYDVITMSIFPAETVQWYKDGKAQDSAEVGSLAKRKNRVAFNLHEGEQELTQQQSEEFQSAENHIPSAQRRSHDLELGTTPLPKRKPGAK